MRTREYVTINVYWFGIAFLWNALHPIVIPALLLQYVPENLKNTYLGGMIFSGLVLAMVVQPLSGALSDRTRIRWGRRRAWIVIGTLFSLVFLFAMAWSGNLPGLVGGYLLLQLASNTAHGPAQGLIPDLVPRERRGLASGVKNLFDMSGLVVTSLIAGRLMGRRNPTLAFIVVAGVLAFSALVTKIGSPEKPDNRGGENTTSYRLRDLLRLDVRRYPDYAWLLVSRFLILFGIYAVQGFAQYYIRDWLGVPNPAEITGNLLALIGLALTLLVFPAGVLSDRFGRRRLNVMAGALAALGIFLLVLVKNVFTLYLFGGLIGLATGIFLSVNWALATNLIPQEEAGKYLGLSNLATAGAGATSRLAGPFIDGINAIRPGAYLGYPMLFVLAALSALLGTVVLRKVQEA